MSKKTNIIIGALILVIVAVVIIVGVSKKQSTVAPGAVGDIPTQTNVQSSTGQTPAETPVVAKDTYTLAQIAAHSTKADCWTTVNGNVYNVTSWISQHPGGQEAILSLCGKDGSAAFNGQHSGDRRPATELASFKIGTLAK